jgi:hypothetical protein
MSRNTISRRRLLEGFTICGHYLYVSSLCHHYRKEIVILLCLTLHAAAETWHLRVHKPCTGPSRYSYSGSTFRLSSHQHTGTLGSTEQHRDGCVFPLEGLLQSSTEEMSVFFLLRGFRRFRKILSVCPSDRPHGTTRLPLDGFL